MIKKLTLLTSLQMVALALSAQTNSFPSSGNVGIGTLSPANRLQVVGTHTDTNISLFFPHALETNRANLNLWASEPGATWTGVGIGNNVGNGYTTQAFSRISLIRGGSYIRLLDQEMRFNVVKQDGTDISALAIAADGTVGLKKLDVDGNIKLNAGLNNLMNRPIISSSLLKGELRGYSGDGQNLDDGLLRLSAGGGTNASAISYIDLSGFSLLPDMDKNIVFGTGGLERMRLLSNGNVGIGTAAPQEKLSVNGKIRAKEIKVEAINWPDYVFEDDYQMGKLADLEKYIKLNKHLPEIPSAKEVEADGIALGEMNKLLLKKIEELTLHLIEKEKQLGIQSKMLESLSNRMLKLELKNKP